MAVSAIPEGYRTVTPYLIVKGGAAAIEFYKKAFGAVETVRMPGPGGTVAHAEIKIGDSFVMLADDGDHTLSHSPQAYGGTPVSLVLYVPDVDGLSAQAIAAGAEVLRPVQNQFYGDRSGTFKDPFGHIWTIGTHVEDVSPAEMEKRMAAMMSNAS
jgi:PhnB protein